jgi:hypothetical protein
MYLWIKFCLAVSKYIKCVTFQNVYSVSLYLCYDFVLQIFDIPAHNFILFLHNYLHGIQLQLHQLNAKTWDAMP